MGYGKHVSNGYIIAVTNTDKGVPINENEYNTIINLVHNKPIAPKDYEYCLKVDLTWELVELTPAPIEDEEATAEDYEAALGRFGV